jgi:hypothetical protein
MVTLIIFLLYCIACATLAYEICTSELAFNVKELLFLDKEYDQVKLFQRFTTYRKLFGIYVWPLLPLVISSLILFKVHSLIYRMLLCIYCTSFHSGFWITLLLGFGITLSLFIALITVFSSYLIYKIRN